MAQNLEGIKAEAENRLTGLIEERKRNLESKLQEYAKSSRMASEEFFKTGFEPLVSEQLKKVGGQYIGEPMAFQLGGLEQSLQSQIGQERFGQKRGTTDVGLSNVKRLISEGRESELGAGQYREDVGTLEKKQAFEASEAEKQRQYQLQMSNAMDEWQRRGLEVPEMYQSQGDYEGALARAIGSIVGLGTGYGLTRYFGREKTPETQTQTVSSYPDLSTYTGGKYVTPETRDMDLLRTKQQFYKPTPTTPQVSSMNLIKR